MKKYSHSFMLARFQPLHNGHKTIIDKMLSESKNVTIILGSAQESGTGPNPLTPEQRLKLIENLYGKKDNMVDPNRMMKMVDSSVKKSIRFIPDGGHDIANTNTDEIISIISK